MNLFHKKLKGFAVTLLAVGACSISGAAVAQQKPLPKTEQATPATSFTDAELKQFANANNRLLEIQKEGEKAMLAILSEEKLSVEKFSEMAQAHQQQKINEVKATEAEFAAFNRSA